MDAKGNHGVGQAGSQTVAQTMHAVDAPFVAADVGGTHARIGLVRGSRTGHEVSVLAYHKYACADYAGLAEILHDFLDHNGRPAITRCALACAGYAIDGVVVNDNLPWKVVIPELRAQLKLDDISLINDFEAVAHATRHMDPSTAIPLTGVHDAARPGAQVVVGPGTGLGSAALIPTHAGQIVLATEAGQIALAPGNALEAEILGTLRQTRSHVSYEHVLSGPGLLALYTALCQLRAETPNLDCPEQITASALADENGTARQTLETFCGLLGGFVGDLAMLYGASGGIWLAGGILPQIHPFLARSSFFERFLDKGRMRAFLERIPIRLMEHGQLGVIGAAGWYLDRQDGG